MNIKYTFIAALLLSLCSNLGRAQIIETVAGDGTYTYNGDSLAATANGFEPVGLAINSKGELYFSTYDSRILKVTVSGIIVTVAGTDTPGGYNGNNIPAINALLETPSGMAFDKYDNLFFCDAGNDQIRKIDTLGIISLVAGSDSGMGSGGGFNGDSLPATQTRFWQPIALFIANDNSILVSDYGNQRIRRITPAGTVTTIAGNGMMGYYGNGIPATDAHLAFPLGLAEDRWGNVFFCDEGSNTLRRIDTNGIITTFCGNGYAGNTGDGGPASAGQLYSPYDVRIDGIGDIYVTNSSAARIRLIDTGLILHTYVGNGYAGYNGDGIPATSAELYLPTMMAFDASYNLYFSDELNYRVRVVNNTEGIAGQSLPKVGFTVYPNPAHSLLNFSFPQGSASITLLDVTGRKVAGVQVGNGAAYALPVGGLLPGVYLYEITTPTQTQRGKVEVE